MEAQAKNAKLIAMSAFAFPIRFRALPPAKLSHHSLLLFFAVVLMGLFIADGTMSYLAPVMMEERTGSILQMGMILSFSSLVGLVCDFVLPQFFRKRATGFFVRGALFIAAFFPLTFLLLPSVPLSFLLGMAIWGVYFEFLRFAQFTFIHRHLHTHEHSNAWGIFETFHAIGTVVGPLLAGYLLEADTTGKMPFLVVIGILVVTAGAFRVLKFIHPAIHPPVDKQHIDPAIQATSGRRELKVWWKLMGRLWPLYLFFFSIIMLDTAFWSVGAVLAEDLKTTHWSGHFFLPAYSLPSLLFSLLAVRFAKPWGKKRIAFILGGLAGCLLLIATWFWQDVRLVPVVFMAAACMAIVYPEVAATFEDYMVRLGDWGDDLVSLQATAANLAYIVGPITAGVVATLFGNVRTIGFFGGWLLVVSLLALALVPRKIKMPLSELEKVS